MFIMISCGSFVVVFSKLFYGRPLLSLFRQAGSVFVLFWWSCSLAPAAVSVYIFHGWLVLYGWWLCLVSYFLLVVLFRCLRQSHDTQWQIVSVSMLLSCSFFLLLFGWACGLVPGGAVM